MPKKLQDLDLGPGCLTPELAPHRKETSTFKGPTIWSSNNQKWTTALLYKYPKGSINKRSGYLPVGAGKKSNFPGNGLLQSSELGKGLACLGSSQRSVGARGWDTHESRGTDGGDREGRGFTTKSSV